MLAVHLRQRHAGEQQVGERDIENAWRSAEAALAGPLDDLPGHSIMYRIAVGARARQKVFVLQTVPAREEGAGHNGAAQAGGFSIHAGQDIDAAQRAKLEWLCRYVSRLPLAVDRLAVLVPPPRMHLARYCGVFAPPWQSLLI